MWWSSISSIAMTYTMIHATYTGDRMNFFMFHTSYWYWYWFTNYDRNNLKFISRKIPMTKIKHNICSILTVSIMYSITFHISDSEITGGYVLVIRGNWNFCRPGKSLDIKWHLHITSDTRICSTAFHVIPRILYTAAYNTKWNPCQLMQNLMISCWLSAN